MKGRGRAEGKRSQWHSAHTIGQRGAEKGGQGREEVAVRRLRERGSDGAEKVDCAPSPHRTAPAAVGRCLEASTHRRSVPMRTPAPALKGSEEKRMESVERGKGKCVRERGRDGYEVTECGGELAADSMVAARFGSSSRTERVGGGAERAPRKTRWKKTTATPGCQNREMEGRIEENRTEV